MTYLIILPSVYEDFTHKCLESMHPSLQANTRVVDNTKDNIGVAASWNLGAKEVLEKETDWLVIISASMRFHDTRGLDLVEALEKTKYLIVQSNLVHSWHLIAINRQVLKDVGLFDENFFPAYYEDCDYSRRVNLHYKDKTGNIWGREDITVCNVGSSHGSLLGGVDVKSHMPEIHEYYIKKWGGLPGHER